MYARRVTLDGIAEISDLAAPQLVQVPWIFYHEAVAAPFNDAGFLVTPSDKGVYQQRVLQLAGGLRFLAWVLRHPQSAALLDLFFEYPREGKAPAGYRRAVRYDELQDELFEIVRGDRKRLRQGRRQQALAWLGAWTDELLERNVLIAGYLLDCAECRGRFWYRSDRVDQQFECSRCGAENVIPARAGRSFKLNEAFYMLRAQGGQVVTLTLATLRNEAVNSYLYLAETEISDGKSSREVDIAALLDGTLVLAEAKSSTSLLKKEVAKYAYLARRCGARRVIFATTCSGSPECEAGDRNACIQRLGIHHADHAWNHGARDAISRARADLATRGISVESLCWADLVAQHGDNPLEYFSRRAPGRAAPDLR